jgi:hypothetical protein
MQIKTSTRKRSELKRDTKSMPRLMKDPRRNQRRLQLMTRRMNSRLLRRRSEESTDPEVEVAEAAEEAVAAEVATSTKMTTSRERGSPSLKRLTRK